MPLTEGQIRKELYEFGPFQVDPQKQTLLRDGQPIGLTPKAFQVLLVLVRRSNQIVSKDELMKAVWPDTFVEETNLTRNIFSVRRALGETEGRRYIITAQGAGYRLAEDAHLVAGRGPQHHCCRSPEGAGCRHETVAADWCGCNCVTCRHSRRLSSPLFSA